jgi:hypothetical protein
MASKPDASMPFLNLGNEQTEAMLSMQSLACPRKIGSRTLVRFGQEAVGESVRPGRRGGLSAMRRAADANGCGRRAATLRRLPKDHANDHAVTVEWTAGRKHVKGDRSAPRAGGS